MIQHDEELLQLHRDLYHWREQNEKRALLLASDELSEDGLANVHFSFSRATFKKTSEIAPEETEKSSNRKIEPYP